MRLTCARMLGVASIAALGFLPAATPTAAHASKREPPRAAEAAKPESAKTKKTRARPAAGARVRLTRNRGSRGARVTVRGSNFERSYAGWVKFDGVRVLDVRTNSSGRFSGSFRVPTNASIGPAEVLASVGSRQDDATFSVRSTRRTTTSPAPVATRTRRRTANSTTSTIARQLIVAPDWRSVRDNTYAASRSNPNLPALPGLKKTDWNIRSGGPFARIETVDGKKALHFHVPAGYKSDEGNARSEQEFNMGSIAQGTWHWVGFDFKTNNYGKLSAWNLALQFKNNGTGSPPASFNINGNKGTGLRVASDGGENYLLDSTATTWHRVVLGFYAAKGSSGQVHGYIDGRHVFSDTNWSSYDASGSGAGRGGTIYDGRSSAYLKFGIYGATVGVARDHYFANMVVAKTREAAMNAPYGG